MLWSMAQIQVWHAVCSLSGLTNIHWLHLQYWTKARQKEFWKLWGDETSRKWVHTRYFMRCFDPIRWVWMEAESHWLSQIWHKKVGCLLNWSSFTHFKPRQHTAHILAKTNTSSKTQSKCFAYTFQAFIFHEVLVSRESLKMISMSSKKKTHFFLPILHKSTC